MKSAYDKIAAGLEDAIAYAEGDKRRAREATVDVKAIRQASGTTQAAFAEAFGLRVVALRDWEQGRFRCPRNFGAGYRDTHHTREQDGMSSSLPPLGGVVTGSD